MTLVVSEVFGPTVQGEGPSAGRGCGFVRTAGCNLSCRWCDTAYTWDWAGVSDMAGERGGAFNPREEMHPRDPADVAGDALRVVGGTGRLVISGGEPMTQQDALAEMLSTLRPLTPGGLHVEVETNGTIAPAALTGHVDQWNVSPKLAHSGDSAERRLVPSALARFASMRSAVFKVVARHDGDVGEVAGLAERYAIPTRRVWIMPLGREPEGLHATFAVVADAAVAHGFNVTSRLHIAAWGDERGR